MKQTSKMGTSPKKKEGSAKEETLNLSATLPSEAHALAATGAKTASVVSSIYNRNGDLFQRSNSADLKKLAEAFAKEWTDDEAAKVVEHYAKELEAGKPIDIAGVSRWVLAHPNNSSAVFDCMGVIPPDDISIIRVLSTAGSQKKVFLANWRLTQKQVVVKRVLEPAALSREMQAHPLSMKNPNIIETHFLANSAGDILLIEELLPTVLNDRWRANGIQEASNLLYDIARALSYLHTELTLVHGDVKPDNIGKKGEDYILLDFGISRPSAQFTPEVTGTGSLRTRAPELVTSNRYNYPFAADIWALGATIFNAVVERFPLFEKGESPPRISTPNERDTFEAMLRTRIETEWDKRVVLSNVPDPLKGVLERMLERDPSKRINAADLLQLANHELSPFLRKQTPVGRFSKLDEIEQILAYLPSGGCLALMPATEKEELQEKLKSLKETSGIEREDAARLDALLAVLK